MIGSEVTELIQGYVIGRQLETTEEDFINTIFPHPTLSEMKNSNLELVVAGTNKGVLMVESEAQQLSEDEMLEAVEIGQKTYNEVIDAIIKLAKKAARDPWDIKEKAEEIKNLPSEIEKNYKSKFIDAYKIQEKQKRSELLNLLRSEINESFESETLSAVVKISEGIDEGPVKSMAIEVLNDRSMLGKGEVSNE